VNYNPDAKSFNSSFVPLTFVSAGSNSDYFKGYLDDIRLYNRELSYAEIGSLYHMTNGACPEPNSFNAFNIQSNQVDLSWTLVVQKPYGMLR